MVIEHFIPPRKTFIPPQNKFLAMPLRSLRLGLGAHEIHINSRLFGVGSSFSGSAITRFSNSRYFGLGLHLRYNNPNPNPKRNPNPKVPRVSEPNNSGAREWWADTKQAWVNVDFVDKADHPRLGLEGNLSHLVIYLHCLLQQWSRLARTTRDTRHQLTGTDNSRRVGLKAAGRCRKPQDATERPQEAAGWQQETCKSPKDAIGHL